MNLKSLYFFLLVFTSSLLPQVMMGNYPIQPGNIWVYRNYFFPEGNPIILSIQDSTVTIDSLHYTVIEYRTSNDTSFHLIRFDTLSNFAVSRLDDGYPALNHEYKYFKLNAIQGETWVVPDPAVVTQNLFIEIFDSINASIFNEWTYIEKYYIHDSIFIYNYGEFWNPKFGLISNANDQGEPVDILTGCVLDGVVYGDTSTVVGIQELHVEVFDYRLEQNYPNPFNPSTTIKYEIPSDNFVTLRIFDVLGNEVTTLVNEEKHGGSYTIKFNASNLASGIYFYQLKVNNHYIKSKKMILMR